MLKLLKSYSCKNICFYRYYYWVFDFYNPSNKFVFTFAIGVARGTVNTNIVYNIQFILTPILVTTNLAYVMLQRYGRVYITIFQ